MEHGRGFQNRSATLGRAAEDQALEELSAAGLQFLARNFRCRLGEIDLVMREGNTLVFVEVRARSAAGFGSAVETITAAKQRRLRASAGVFLACHPALRQMPARFDLFAVDGAHAATQRVRWIRGILD